MEIFETLALRKELGSLGYVTGSKMLEQGYGEGWVTSMFQGECEIQFPGFSEAIVVSIDFGVPGHRSALGLVLCNRKRTLKLMVSAQAKRQTDLDHLRGIGDINADAEDPAVILFRNIELPLEFVRSDTDGECEIQFQDYE
ncbi:Succinate--Coa Ligase [Adp-Forming] Subunit Beta [Manis pentadactyla]|nr:Succinate--Coa Ligase [Adp-Forming] Subunit Beta [Manis pentadactyla]